MDVSKRPFQPTSAFKRIVLDIKTEDAVRYDEALAKTGYSGPRGTHVRSLILAFVDSTQKVNKRGK